MRGFQLSVGNLFAGIGLVFSLFLSAAVTVAQGRPDGGLRFDRLDRNNDGKLSRAEFKGPSAAFDRLDQNGNGFLTKQEIRQTQRDSFSSRIPQGSNQRRDKTEAIQKTLVYIDTHNHLAGLIGSASRGQRKDYFGAAQAALATMDQVGMRFNLLMPPPQTTDQHNKYSVDELLDVAKRYPDRFALLGGGGTLNPIIQEAVQAGRVTNDMRSRFERHAEDLIRKGVVGFGEMTAEHLSFNPTHPYVAAPPDHPLFLQLADIAARHDVPIDLHMEAIPKEIRLPTRLKSPPNPQTLTANIANFERLLAHNRQARIVWVHLGWDSIGYRTPEMTDELLERHGNLYMSIRIVPLKDPQARPENRMVDRDGRVSTKWLALLKKHADRFVIGSDEFYLSPQMRMSRHPSTGSTEATISFLLALPSDLARKIGYENAVRIYRLDR